MAKRMWEYCSLLSLDVVAGAMAGQYFFSELFRIPHEPIKYFLLGIAVWSIYTFDHLWDAKQAELVITPRHQFHQRNNRVLQVCFGIGVLVGLVLGVWDLGKGVELFASLGLGCVILVTMILLRNAGKTGGVLKELNTAVFYVVGIAWFSILKLAPIELGFRNLYLFGLYILLAFLNLLMLSFLDHEKDKAQGFSSAAAVFDPLRLVKTIQRFALGLVLLALAAFIFMPSFYRPFACVLLLMILLQYFSFFHRHLSSEEKRKRMEASFLLPLLLMAI